MSILVCGSMAYDSIMVFRDYFKNHIMPDQIHKLSVAFYTPEMEKITVVLRAISDTT
jgi:adenosine kinase